MTKSPVGSTATISAVSPPLENPIETHAALRKAFESFREQPDADAKVGEWLAHAHPSLVGLTTRG